METNAAEQRLHSCGDFESGQWTMTELCERFGISRPTGYKWMGRSRDPGGSLAEPAERRTGARTGPRRESRHSSSPHAASMAGEPRSCGRCSRLAIALSVAGAQHDQRHPRAARAAAQAQAPQEVASSRCRTAAHGTTEPGLAGGLQGAIQDRRRPILLPADRDRSLQPQPARLPRPALGPRPKRRQPVFRTALPRGRSSGRDPHRQRRPLRVDRHPRIVRSQRLVDAARHRSPAHPSLQPAGERYPRADASRAQARDGTPGGEHRCARSSVASIVPPSL